MNDYYQFRDETGTPIDYYQLVNDNNELCKEIERLKKELEEYKKDFKEANDLALKLITNNQEYVCKSIKDTIDILIEKLQQKENIIKEVREYIEEHTTYERYGYIDELQLIDLDFSIKDLKQILDKENI